MKYQVRIDDSHFDVEVDGEPPHFRVQVDGRPLQVDAAPLDDAVWSLLVDGTSFLSHIVACGGGTYEVSIGGKVARLEVLDELSAMAQKMKSPHQSSSFVLKAPMPGLVVRLCVQVGATVEVGTPLVIMEAMKMQNELASEVRGVVREVHIGTGTAVDSGTPLVAIEAD